MNTNICNRSSKLPDLRGEFIRRFDDGRGIDANRTLLSTQTDALQNITGGINGVSESLGSFDFDASRVVRTAAETRPRNIAFCYILRAS
ncbi:hypothetical protein [Yersinia enterocolitica]|uniref:hypothetical protein n=1 Tax=Yersinia enterocolitica TaxID=630 RepID=UPI0027E514DE|nr:hypothetical protein [Yersinia enterocolitica]MBW5832389.1 hypothetical protein [Yersinia enterocolitica]